MSEKALPAFHALDDNTSLFSGSGKKSACAKWSTRPELTATLYHLMDKPETPSSDDIAVIESFVISLYSVSCILTDVNQTQHAQSSRTFQYLQPTKAALVEHVERTTHQARASRVGIKSETGWVPFWTALHRATETMNVLISCGCTTSCTGRYSCYKKGFVCTVRCRCPGHCYGHSNNPSLPPSN